MKRLLIFLMAVSLLAACNNDKGNGRDEKRADYREKDDYGTNDDQSNEKSRKDDDSNSDENTGSDGWTERDKAKFFEECMGGFENSQDIGKKVCPCALAKYEKKYASYDEAKQKGSEAEGEKFGKECALELNINGNNKTNKDNNTDNDDNEDDDGGDYASGGWTSNQVKSFVVPCVREAQKGGMEYLDAQSYCDCMQYKIAKIYSASEADKLTEADLKTPSMKKMIKSCLSEN